MHRYQFTSTMSDLLDAEEADSTEVCGIRRSLRWAIAALAGTFLIIVLFSGRFQSWEQILPILFWGYLVYYFAIKSYLRRWRMRRHNAAAEEVAIDFGDDCISLDVPSYGKYIRGWDELLNFKNANKGILLYFTDGAVNWLPDRVFIDKAEKTALIAYLESRVSLLCNED